MKKIYLVKAINTEELQLDGKSFVSEVFTNFKLAEAYVEYWNNAEKHNYHYWISEKEICKADYRDLLKVDY